MTNKENNQLESAPLKDAPGEITDVSKTSPTVHDSGPSAALPENAKADAGVETSVAAASETTTTGEEKVAIAMETEKSDAIETAKEEMEPMAEESATEHEVKQETESSSKTENKEEKVENKKQENKAIEEDTTAAMQRPIKRARTAYFIFAEDKRPELQKQHAGEGVAVVAKALGQLWAALPDEEKQVYQQKAAEERSRVQAELQARQAAGLVPEPAPGSSNAPLDPTALVFPVARVRKIIKLDPEIRGLSKEALTLVTKAAECCLVKLGQESVRVANMQNRRKLLPEDVAMVCQTRSAFAFLKDDLKDLVAQQQQQQTQQQLTDTASNKRKAEMPSQSNKLTSYFNVKSKDS